MSDFAIVKRVELAGLFEGWDAECFARVKPATAQEKTDFRKASFALSKVIAEGGDPGDAAVEADMQQELVDSHFVSGRIKALNDAGEFELVDMTKEHIQVADISDRLYMEILGLDLDPKDIAAVAAENKKLSEGEKPTETPSSTSSNS